LPNAFGEYDETPAEVSTNKNISRRYPSEYHRWMLRYNPSMELMQTLQDYKPRFQWR
jgi:hypothetical protein